MSSHHAPRHCFQHAFWYPSANRIVCQFTEGEIYVYLGVILSQWQQFKADAHRGHDWNKSNIAFRRYGWLCNQVTVVPTGWNDSF